MATTPAENRAQTFKIIEYQQVTVVTARTPVSPDSNVNAVFVEIINNTVNKVAVGMSAAAVDAGDNPIKGQALLQYSSYKLAVPNDASDVFIDADVDGTVVTVAIWGRS